MTENKKEEFINIYRENISRLLHGTESRFRWHTDAP